MQSQRQYVPGLLYLNGAETHYEGVTQDRAHFVRVPAATLDDEYDRLRAVRAQAGSHSQSGSLLAAWATRSADRWLAHASASVEVIPLAELSARADIDSERWHALASAGLRDVSGARVE
jgi:hypothetical protein